MAIARTEDRPPTSNARYTAQLGPLSLNRAHDKNLLYSTANAIQVSNPARFDGCVIMSHQQTPWQSGRFSSCTKDPDRRPYNHLPPCPNIVLYLDSKEKEISVSLTRQLVSGDLPGKKEKGIFWISIRWLMASQGSSTTVQYDFSPYFNEATRSGPFRSTRLKIVFANRACFVELTGDFTDKHAESMLPISRL